MVDNTDKIIEALMRTAGSTITELVNATNMSRTQVRTAIAFLLGAKKINERCIGMAKFYTVNR